MFKSAPEVMKKLAAQDYLVDKKVATVIFLALQLNKPLLIEGPSGVGKTELAKVLAGAMSRPLIRLQCYEGLDETKALYEWNYQKQLLRLQIEKNNLKNWQDAKQDIFSKEFLLQRPLLKALMSQEPVVLLIDEVDKSDEEFESFLLEILSDYQVTVPEIGTVRASFIPVVVLTSNNTRQLSDALKRRCIHLYLDYPDAARELEIVRLKVPSISQDLARQIVNFVQNLRKQKFKKAPSIAETIEWARALMALDADSLNEELLEDTINVLLKYQTDIDKLGDKKLTEKLV